MSSIEQQEIEILRSRVSRLEAEMEYLFKHFGLTFSENASPGDDPRVIEALKKNNLIEAIKAYRELTNSGLAEAKTAVEEIRRRRGI
jgi:ribosomal protein L7/L12